MRTRITSAAGSVRTQGRNFTVAPLLPPLIFIAGIIVGWASLAHSDLPDPGAWTRPDQTGFVELLAMILGRNLSAALLLFSGTCTAGFSTILSLGFLSTYVGATFGAAASNVGVSTALGSIIWYAPIEFLGLLVAATAGITPVVEFVRAAFSHKPQGPLFVVYVRSLRTSMRYLAVAAGVITLGAVIEAGLLSVRS